VPVPTAIRKAADVPDPRAAEADPALLQKILDGTSLTDAEIHDWKRWVQRQHDEKFAAYPAHALAARVLNLNPDGSPLTFNSALRGENSSTWLASNAAELERWYDLGVWRPVHPADKPKHVKATYYGPKVKEKLKTNRNTGEQYIEHRVRGTLGGDRLAPFGLTSSTTAEVEVFKSFFNMVVSRASIYFTMDIKDFYLGTNLPDAQEVYVAVPLHHYTDAVLDKYQLRPFIHGDRILHKVVKSAFGLKNAGKLARDRLDIDCLNKAGYYEDAIVPCIYRHDTNGTIFVLVVDDFAVSCTTTTAKEHLINTLKTAGYTIDIDHQGKKYCGLTVNYNRKAGYLDISMPGYVDKLLTRFQSRDIKPTDSPIIYTPPVYGAKAQLTTPPDESDALTADQLFEAQAIIGAALWYARMVDVPTYPAVAMLTTELGSQRSSIFPKIDRLLGHLKKYPNNKIRYYASDMVYHAFSDVSYLSVSKGRSRVGGIGFFGWKNAPQRLNGAVCTISKVLDVVVSSACEGEYGAAYMVARNAVWMRAIARALGYPQPPTTILVDNTCAVGLANDTIKTARTKAIDVRFHWLRDRVRQQQFNIVWCPTGHNKADFFTKALPVHEHLSYQRDFVLVD
jgi:hypothetical protein